MVNGKLQRLKEKWEKILEKEGLGDIEKRGYLRIYHDRKLSHNSTQRRWSGAQGDQTWHPIKNEAKEAYYQLACEFLHSHDFESDKERKIWELHSQGLPVREIAQKVRQPRNWSQLNKKLQKLRKLMLQKTCLP